MENGFVKGVNVQKTTDVESVRAKIVIDAEGVSSRFLREAGLARLNREGLVYAVEAELENVSDLGLDAVDVFMGKDYAPGFYGWLIPRSDGTAKVGLAAKTGNPKELLQRLMLKHPVASKKLAKSSISRLAFHPITLGGPVSKAFADGFLAVGDVASQVKPTTGGGVVFGLICAQMAAETAANAIKKNNFSAEVLHEYQKSFMDKLGFDISVMLRLRRFFDSLSDEKLDQALRVCNRLGLGEALADVDEIDFQGKLMLQLLTKPTAVAALTYFLFLYLSANP
jgi:flavin-dependent dehydrogenase